jgi:hypothetical protein
MGGGPPSRIPPYIGVVDKKRGDNPVKEIFGKNVPPPINGMEDIFITMDVVVLEKQIINFLRRRFSSEDLLWIVNDVQEMIDEGESVDTAVYDGIRDFIKSKKFTEIDEFGDEQSYWDSYLKFERPLVSYVKMKLGLK